MSEADRMNEVLRKLGLEQGAIFGGPAHPTLLSALEEITDRLIAVEKKVNDR